MKRYTDIEQSKKLAEFLSVESADGFWDYDDFQKEHRIDWFVDGYDKECFISANKNNVCAWSLTALLDVLPVSCDDGQHCLALINPNPNDKTEWLCAYEDCKGDLMMECYADNSVDACYEMILKLHELKML